MTVRGILLDPERRSVEEVSIDISDVKSIQEAIGARAFDVALMQFDDGVEQDVFVDDEGLLVEGQSFFFVPGMHAPLGGKGLIFSVDDEGATCDAIVSVEEVKRKVKFYSHFQMFLAVNAGEFAGDPEVDDGMSP